MLPFRALEAWGDGLSGASAATDAERFHADRRLARERMRRMLEDPVAEEAIYLASPALHAMRGRVDADPGIETALAKYLSRMATRCTPFGLFAGTSVGSIGARTGLELQERTRGRRHTRLDTELVEQIVQRLVAEPEVRAGLRFVRNSSLTEIAGKVHYAQARTGSSGRSYYLVDVDPHEPLLRGLARARVASTLDEVARAIAGEEIEFPIARQFTEQLVDAQLLVPVLGPAVTGAGALEHLIEELTSCGAAPLVLERLCALRDGLRELDVPAPFTPVERYHQLSAIVDGFVPVRPDRFVQVDLVKPAERVEVQADLARELLQATLALVDLFGYGYEDPLADFKRAFEARYEERTLPLAEVLDDEIGIGFEFSRSASADPSPLLRSLPFPAMVQPERVLWGSRGRYLLAKLAEVLEAGAHELVLDPTELERFHDPDTPELADAFHVMATVLEAGESSASDAPDAPRALLDSAGGPSGARLLGRFCHGDPRMEAGVREHLRAEEALDPAVRYFEVVHLPEGRTGNILARPVLRDFELEFLGRSGAAPSQCLHLDDLTVTVSRGRVVLHSRSLGCEVRPRITTAHDHRAGSLPLYRFLSALQFEGRVAGVTWLWGPLDTLPRLPRVRIGRIVLARARWTLGRAEIEGLRGNAHESFRRVQELRARRGLPRWIGLVDRDNVLTVDLDNPLLVEAFVDTLRGSQLATVQEHFPGARPDTVIGPEGRYTNEVLVPFVRRAPSRVLRRPVAALDDGPQPSFAPGSDWLAAKIYTGTAMSDELLTALVHPLTEALRGQGLVDRWFFVRFGDPDWHLRVRWHGQGGRLCAEVLPRLHDALRPWLEDRRVHRVQIDTYQRESRRYGGPQAMEAVEELFWHDSEFVARFVASHTGDEGLDARWRMAALAMDQSMVDAGMDLSARRGLTGRLSAMYAEEFGVDGAMRARLRERFREERRALDVLLGSYAAGVTTESADLQLLRVRSSRSADAHARLRALEDSGGLHTPLDEIVASLLHMHANRMLRGAHRAHEMVLHRFLEKTYASMLARQRGAQA